MLHFISVTCRHSPPEAYLCCFLYAGLSLATTRISPEGRLLKTKIFGNRDIF
jgi:hypothetical protein